MLAKCMGTKLWFNSEHIFRQFQNIGDVISKLLVKANITTFESLLGMHPSRIENIVNKNPPFGIRLIETVKNLPQFEISFQYLDTNSRDPEKCLVAVHCIVKNNNHIKQAINNGSVTFFPMFYFVLGDSRNNLISSVQLK